MISIRRHLAVSLLTSLFVVIAVCGALLFALIRRALVGEFDRALLARARAFSLLAQQEASGGIEFDFTDDMIPAFGRGRRPDYFEMWHEDGRRFARSRSLGTDGDLPRPPQPSHEPGITDLRLPDGRPGRAVSFVYTLAMDPDDNAPQSARTPRRLPARRLVLMMAQNREGLDQMLGRMLALIIGTGVALPPLIAALVLRAVGRGLRPLERLAREADAVDPANLRHRFAEAGVPLELRPITHRLNDLLRRMEAAFKDIEAAYARERRFNDDVAHELRTPLAELHSLTEIAILFPQNQELGRKALGETLAITRQMERLVGALLTLARHEAGIERLKIEAIDLGEAAAAAWKPLEERAARRGLTCSWAVAAELSVAADRALLDSILGNLFSNAVDHSPEGGRVAVRARREAEMLALEIENSNDSLEGADLEHVFEPFWQKDGARSRVEHSGLGLPLARTMSRMMGVELNVVLDEGGTVFRAGLTFSGTRAVASASCKVKLNEL